MGRFDGQSVVVTGGGHGIGAAIAAGFAREGAAVVVTDVNEEWLGASVDAIAADGGTVLGVAGDVSKTDDVGRVFSAAVEAHGVPHVLVNSAALLWERHFLDADEGWWRRVVDVNLNGVFFCSHRFATLAAPLRRGAIISLSSGGATRAHRGMPAYDACKGGIEALTRAMALDLGPYGIRTMSLIPGSINTYDSPEATRASRGNTIPIGRQGDAEDLVGAALFFASAEASYMTGTRIEVDGGLLAQQRSPEVDIFGLDRFPVVPDAR